MTCKEICEVTCETTLKVYFMLVHQVMLRYIGLSQSGGAIGITIPPPTLLKCLLLLTPLN